MSQKIWVVEMKMWDWDDDYEPTVGVGLTREDGRRVVQEWKRLNPVDKFRLVKYVREGI